MRSQFRPAMREIIRSTVWSGFREIIREIGGDPDAILAAAGVDVALLENPEVYLQLRCWLDSQNIAAEQLGRTDLGLLLGQKQPIDNLGPLAMAITSAETARRAIEIFAKYMFVHCPPNVLSLTPLPGTQLEILASELALKNPEGRLQNDERVISGLHAGLRMLIGTTYQPEAIWFKHAPLSSPNTYRGVFGVMPEFDMPSMGILLPRKSLDMWRPNGSAALRRISESFLTRYGRPEEISLEQRVAGMARSLLQAGEFTPRQAAHALGMHERTLQRRLREAGSSFETIKDTARRDWAEALLCQPAVSLTRIALMLDYSDLSAFSRSCRRWFGVSPTAYRSRRQTNPQPVEATERASRVNSLEATLRARRRADV